MITEDQRSLCIGMRNAIMARDHTAALIDAEGICEITGQVEDPEYGISVKVRPDKLLSGQPIILSLKTCQSVADRDYLRSTWTYGWHLSAAFYCRAMQAITGELHRYWEVAVESAGGGGRYPRRGQSLQARAVGPSPWNLEYAAWPRAGRCCFGAWLTFP